MIILNKIGKVFADKTALYNISFNIDKTGVFGIIGHTGAGKSTLLKIISANDAATEGEITVLGKCPVICEKEIKQSVSYLSEENPLWKDMSVLEHLLFIADAKKVNPEKAYKQAQEVMSLFEIEDIQNRLVKNLTDGEKKLVGIACTFLANPKIIVLDEPFKKLNATQKKILKNALCMLGEIKTVVIAVSKPSDILDICHKVALLSKGGLVAFDAPSALEERMSAIVTLEVSAKTERETIISALTEQCGFEADDVTVLPCNLVGYSKVKLEYNSASNSQQNILSKLEEASISDISCKSYTLTLDDVCYISNNNQSNEISKRGRREKK